MAAPGGLRGERNGDDIEQDAEELQARAAVGLPGHHPRDAEQVLGRPGRLVAAVYERAEDVPAWGRSLAGAVR